MTRIGLISGMIAFTFALVGGFAFFVIGCTLHRPESNAQAIRSGEPHATVPAGMHEPSHDIGKSAHPPVRRVGGDMLGAVEFTNGEYRSGPLRIPTPLPSGYPAPTPPGSIELKDYPLARRAGISGTIKPDWGMNFAFFPLLNHIKRRSISMTSPVEMNYTGLRVDGAGSPEEWTMAFLYRTPDLGETGVDESDSRILIDDIPPARVIAIGMRGPYKLERVKAGAAQLHEWLRGQSEWEEAGEPRALYYNGPEVEKRDLWSEVQIPVRQRSSTAEDRVETPSPPPFESLERTKVQE